MTPEELVSQMVWDHAAEGVRLSSFAQENGPNSSLLLVGVPVPVWEKHVAPCELGVFDPRWGLLEYSFQPVESTVHRRGLLLCATDDAFVDCGSEGAGRAAGRCLESKVEVAAELSHLSCKVKTLVETVGNALETSCPPLFCEV